MTGRVWFQNAYVWDTPPEVREAAIRALAWAVKDLSLPSLRLAWFKPEGALARTCRETQGDPDCPWTSAGENIKAQAWVTEDRVWLRADLSAEEAAHAALHEARHHWQQAHGLPRAQWEADAGDYAREALKRYETEARRMRRPSMEDKNYRHSDGDAGEIIVEYGAGPRGEDVIVNTSVFRGLYGRAYRKGSDLNSQFGAPYEEQKARVAFGNEPERGPLHRDTPRPLGYTGPLLPVGACRRADQAPGANQRPVE